MRAEMALARLTARTTMVTRDGAGGVVEISPQEALMALRDLPALATDLVFAKWMDDAGARASAERQLLLTVVDWPWMDERSRSGEMRKHAGVLRAMCHVAVVETITPPVCRPCSGTGWAICARCLGARTVGTAKRACQACDGVGRDPARHCERCQGAGARHMSVRRRAELARAYLACASPTTWWRIERHWRYHDVLAYALDMAGQGIRQMQSRLSGELTRG